MCSLRQSLAQKSVNTFNHNSSADWARELFKPFVIAERLVFTIQKNWEDLDLTFSGVTYKKG